MPSRPLPPHATAPAPSVTDFHHHHNRPPSSRVFPPLGVATTASFSFLLFLTFCFRKISRKRTVPSDSKPPHRFSYSKLRAATNSFSPSLRLGQGGFGSVFRGTLPNGQLVAIKVMDSGSLQGEREFQNELYFASKLDSPYVVPALGFSSDRKRRSMLLIYELMPNGNLQDALIHRKCPELMEWKKRFDIAVSIARGIDYLHNLDPPLVHGDIKPSNILLDQCFSAKIGDFGLAWSKTENQNHCGVKIEDSDLRKMNGGLELKEDESEINNGAAGEDNGSVVEETESVTTGFEEFNFGLDQSPESFHKRSVSLTSPEMAVAVSAWPETGGAAVVSPEANFDGASAESSRELVNGGKGAGERLNGEAGKRWWWKQDHSGLIENRPVKDYVMEWIGTEIKNERPNSDWIGSSSSSGQRNAKINKKKNRKRLDWWVSLDEDKEEKILKKEKRKPREWWKEEYCEELEKKKKKKNKKKEVGMTSDNNEAEEWWPREEDAYSHRKKKRSRSKSSRGSIDWFSGDLLRGHHNGNDFLSGDIPKSGGVSSTPSMRGTVCYVAPECGGNGELSEKSDVYSFGVLLLVLIAGRRPLEVTNSPMSEFQRANLIHWARNLSRTGKLLDLVDLSVKSLDREEALLCITVALLCLQKSPALRPSMKHVVGMLSGESEVPQLPTEFSPSPPSRFPFKSKSLKKFRAIIDVQKQNG